MPAGGFADMVTIGRVVKPQGRKGEVAVVPISDQPGRFEALTRVYAPGADGKAALFEVTWQWPHKGRRVLKLAGVDSIDDAERLRGVDLRIPEEDLAALPAGSYYHHELRGLRVEDEQGRPIGLVKDILETGAGADVLVVTGAGGESLFPLVSSFIKQVDVQGGRLVVVAPPELVNAAH
jgi:16S rRNA processing protein RimM